MNMQLMSNARVVLVEPSHPGNIGAVARAMKSMCLYRLYLVRPKRFPSADATARAAGADDILFDAVICDSLPEALAGCVWVVGTSARDRSIQWPMLTPRQCAVKMTEKLAHDETALVFGREQAGLTNQELDHCHALVQIPTNSDYCSLNLAAAVQVLTYELQLAVMQASSPVAGEVAEAGAAVSQEEMDGFYEHLEQMLVDVGYLDPEKPKKLMRRLRRMFNRTLPDRSEMNILRGVLGAAQRASRRKN